MRKIISIGTVHFVGTLNSKHIEIWSESFFGNCFSGFSTLSGSGRHGRFLFPMLTGGALARSCDPDPRGSVDRFVAGHARLKR